MAKISLFLLGMGHPHVRKPGKLNELELRHMRQHPLKGLDATSFLTQGLEEWNGWKEALQAVEREHHLRYDGKGYPTTQKSPDEISLFSWVISMADALDAMTTMRPYVEGRPTLADKIKDIKHNSGKQFHPDVAKNSPASFSRFQRLFLEYIQGINISILTYAVELIILLKIKPCTS